MALPKESGLERIEIITGVERRRRYSDAERAAVLARCDERGATIVGVAKTLGISPSLIHNWKRLRREAEKIASEPMQFIPYGTVPEQPSCAFPPAVSAPIPAAPVPPQGPTLAEELIRPYPGARPGGIDINLRNGIRLAVDSYVNEKALARVLRALREVS